jgi:hypothetical protein
MTLLEASNTFRHEVSRSPALPDKHMLEKLIYRIRWHLYRTPFAGLIKACKRMMLWSSIRERRSLAETVLRTELHVKQGQELKKNGYVDISVALDANLLQELDCAGNQKLSMAAVRQIGQKSSHKNYWTRLLDEDMKDGRFDLQSPFVRVAIQPSVVSILSEVYEEIPRLDYVLLTLSNYSGENYKVSQLWHKDYDDTRVVKLFIYLTDVSSPDDGPFTFFSGPDSDKFGFSLTSHHSDRVLDAKIGLKNVRSVIAPKLTAFLVDTSRCLHMGSRVSEGHRRLLYTATYISSPRLYPEPPSKFSLTGAEGRVLQLLLTADSR